MRQAMAGSAGVAMVVALALGVPASAPAAPVMLQPQPAEARTFATSAGGWTPEIDYGGVCAVPGLTCPRGSAEHVTGGGAGGPGDGFLRSRVTTVVGLLSNVVITWSSPSFTAPPQVDRAPRSPSRCAAMLGAWWPSTAASGMTCC
jgi:hypothetical protein